MTNECISTRVECPACRGSGLVPRISLSAAPPSDEIERLRAALTSIKSMAAAARQTMIASDILETARKALAGASAKPESKS